MDQNLRITVGNEMYYDGSRPRSPRDDPRNRMGAQIEGARYDERMDDPYRRPSGFPPHYGDRGPWGPGADWNRPPDSYLPPRPERPRYDDGRGYYGPGPWSPEKITYDPELHRQYPERRSRSPSPSRGRSPYRKRTPSPYSSYSKMRRRSGSPSPPRKRSISPRQRVEDVLGSMYGAKKEPTTRRSDTHARGALDALRESYNFEKGERHHSYSNDQKLQRVAADDEEAFLYGEDSGVSRYHKETKPRLPDPPRRKTPEPVITQPQSNKKETLTPGGFDTNALKNVLKAIGFDFELSAQSLQKAAAGKAPAKDAIVKPKESDADDLALKASKPPVSDSPAPSNPLQQALQTGQYVPQNIASGGPDSAFIFNQAAMQYSSTMGIPVTVAQQMLFQQNAGTIVPLVQQAQPQPELPLTVPDRPNLKVVPTVSLEDKEKKAMINSAKKLEKEKKARKKRLDYLEIELKNLKKKQAEITQHRKKSELNKSDKRQIYENSLMQAGVMKQIKDIRAAAEKAAGIKSSSESDSEDSSGSSSSEGETLPNYVDAGNYLCRDCNVPKHNLSEYLYHLQSKPHRKHMDKDYKPWYKPIKFTVKSTGPTLPLKGVQFLLPVNAFYCRLCKIYNGDIVAAEQHVRTHEHNLKYAKFCKKNPDYEKQENDDIVAVAEKLKKLKEEQRNWDLKVNSKRKEEKLKFRELDRKSFENSDPKTKEKLKQDVQKPEKYYNDRKPRYMKPNYSSEGEKRDYGPLPPPIKPGYYDKNRDGSASGSSRSSSRMHEKSPLNSKDTRIRDQKELGKLSKYYFQHDDRYGRSPDVRSLPQKRSHSPHGRLYSDRSEPNKDQYKYPEKRRYEDVRNVITKDDKKKQRKPGSWSPGYDELEERREKNEKVEEEKKSKSPDSTFGKFTWKKVDKGKPKKPEPEEAKNGKPSETKFSIKLEAKTNTVPRVMKDRTGFGTFAPHTKILTQRQDEQVMTTEKSSAKVNVGSIPVVQKRVTRSNSSKKSVQPVPPPAEKPVLPMVRNRKKSFEPPPPGTEGAEDIFQGSDDEEIGSDVSGISMEIGSDAEP